MTTQEQLYDSDVYGYENLVVLLNTNIVKNNTIVNNILKLNPNYNINTKYSFNRTIIAENDIYRVDIFYNIACIIPYIHESTKKDKMIENIKTIEKYICHGIKLRNYLVNMVNEIGFKIFVYYNQKIEIEGYDLKNEKSTNTMVNTDTFNNNFEYKRKLYFNEHCILSKKIPEKYQFTSPTEPTPSPFIFQQNSNQQPPVSLFQTQIESPQTLFKAPSNTKTLFQNTQNSQPIQSPFQNSQSLFQNTNPQQPTQTLFQNTQPTQTLFQNTQTQNPQQPTQSLFQNTQPTQSLFQNTQPTQSLFQNTQNPQTLFQSNFNPFDIQSQKKDSQIYNGYQSNPQQSTFSFQSTPSTQFKFGN